MCRVRGEPQGYSVILNPRPQVHTDAPEPAGVMLAHRREMADQGLEPTSTREGVRMEHPKLVRPVGKGREQRTRHIYETFPVHRV